MKIIPGCIYRVSEGSGLSSNRRGIAVKWYRGESEEFFKEIDPGRYKKFDPTREAVLFDPINLRLFVMYKGRLILDEHQDPYWRLK